MKEYTYILCIYRILYSLLNPDYRRSRFLTFYCNVASSITLDLNILEKWGSQNLITFNTSKTQCCLISRRENKNFPDFLFGSNTLTIYWASQSHLTSLGMNNL